MWKDHQVIVSEAVPMETVSFVLAVSWAARLVVLYAQRSDVSYESCTLSHRTSQDLCGRKS